MSLSDRELIRRYVEQRAEDAFAELVRRHVDLVYRAALRKVGDPHLAEDVTQAVFSALARKAPALVRHQTIIGWLHTATRFAASEFLRAERRRRWHEQEAGTMHERLSEPADRAAWEQLRPVIDDVIGELHERDRNAVLLRFFANSSFTAVGAALNVSENTARMRVERALDKLHGLLARRGITSTAAALATALAHQASAVGAPTALAASITSAALASGMAGVTGAVTSAVLISPVATGFATTAFEIMSATKTVLGIAGLLASLMTLGVAIHQLQARNEAEAALAAARQEQAVHATDLRIRQGRAESLEQEALRLQRELDDARAAAERAPAASAPASTAVAWDPQAEGRAFLERHPDVKRALVDYVGASLRFGYAPMYRELGLTPEQIRRWEAVRGAGTSMGAALSDGSSISLQFGSAPGPEWSSQTRDAIGEEGWRRIMEFQQIASARGVVAEVAATTYFTDTPLTPEQADRLVHILAESRNTGPRARSSAYDWNAVIAKSGEILAPRQLAVLTGKRAADQFHQALNRPRDATGTPPAAASVPGK